MSIKRTIFLEGEAMQHARDLARVQSEANRKARETRERYDAEMELLGQRATIAGQALWQKILAALDLPEDLKGHVDISYVKEHDLAFLVEHEEDLRVVESDSQMEH